MLNNYSIDVHMSNFEAQKKEIELSLARTILTKIEKKIITFKEGQEIARFIVDRLDNVRGEEKFLVFLNDLAKQWDIFATTRDLYRINYAS